jgi:hypothetical protein
LQRTPRRHRLGQLLLQFGPKRRFAAAASSDISSGELVIAARPTITSISEGPTVNMTEAASSGGTPVNVGLAGTGAVAGQVITVTWGGQTYTQVLTAADIAANTVAVQKHFAWVATNHHRGAMGIARHNTRISSLKSGECARSNLLAPWSSIFCWPDTWPVTGNGQRLAH